MRNVQIDSLHAQILSLSIVLLCSELPEDLQKVQTREGKAVEIPEERLQSLALSLLGCNTYGLNITSFE
jgi:hypothetical protein